MKRLLLSAAAVFLMSVPCVAAAQPDPSCVRSNDQTSATGTVLGALGGALIGDAVAGRHNRGVGVIGGALAGGVTGNLLAGQHNDPCPPAYGYGPPPPPPSYGYGPPPPPEYREAPPPPQYGVWRGAPIGIHERIDFLYHRIGDARANGWLGRHDAMAAYKDLGDIRHQESDLLYRNGGTLFPPDRYYLEQRLQTLSARINWQTHGG